MDKTLVILGICTAIAYVIFGFLRPQLAAGGLDESAQTFLQSIPWIIVSIFAAGLVSQFLNPALIARYLSRDAGLKAIVIGASMGLLGTGSRWAVYPLAAGLISAEASYGAVFAFVTTWQLVSLPRVPAEIPFFGTDFTIIRAVMSFFIAIIGGILVEMLGLGR